MSYLTEAKTFADRFIVCVMAYKVGQKDEDLLSAIQAWQAVYRLIVENNPHPDDEDFRTNTVEVMRIVYHQGDLTNEITRIPPTIRGPVLIIGFVRYMLKVSQPPVSGAFPKALYATDEWRQLTDRYRGIVNASTDGRGHQYDKEACAA